MVEPKEFLEAGQIFHGHVCTAMPMGLRGGAAAMNKLGVERSKDGQLLALVEIGDNHCATCFADGIQMISGCTFGNGNINKLHYGKWGVTLVDTQTGRAVCVTPKVEAMLTNKKSEFFAEYRIKHIAASKVPAEVVEPLVEKVMKASDDMLLNIGKVCDYEAPPKVESLSRFIYDICNEMVAEDYGRSVEDNKMACLPCYEKARN